jgi:subtilisin family serine protease
MFLLVQQHYNNERIYFLELLNMTIIKFTQNTPNLTLKSYNGGEQGFTSITNELSYAIKLYFIDLNGVEVAYDTVPASGSTVRQSASMSHAWRIRDLDGNFVAEFYGDTDQITLSKTSIEFTFDDANLTVPKTFFSANEFVHQTFGYGIINVAKALDVPYSEAPFTGSRISSYDNSASLKYINDYNLWKQGYDGKGVTVAVIGTGIDSNNIEFSGRIVGGYDFGNNDSNPIAGTHPHETGIAGIIAGSATLKVEGSLYDTIGVAPAASILNIKNQKDDGFGATDSTIAKSILYAVDHGAKVISISQGNAGAYKSDELYSAAKYAQDHNVLIAVAAGNDFKDSLGIPAFAWIGLNNFIVVGNWNMDGYNLFSSSNKLGSVDVPYVVAPSSGWQVQLNNSYAYYEDGGTSSAKPYVSGLAVLLFQQHPDWTPAQVISRITSTATSPYSLSVSSPQLPTINTLPTGEVTLLGVAQQNQTLVASNNIADGNGLGSITYQWFSNGQIISNANKSFYALTQTDVGKTISVTASYVDGLNKEETVSSTGVMVSNSNDLPTGNVSISGSTEQNKTLTASNDIADLDGMGVISYQWLRNGAIIPNQTQINYTLTQTDVGNTISVKASYIDAHGAQESLTSLPTTKVSNVNDSPSGSLNISGQTAPTDILTIFNTLQDADSLGTINYAWLRDGVKISGANQDSYTLSIEDAGKKISAQASYTDLGGTKEVIDSNVISIDTLLNFTPSTNNDFLIGTDNADKLSGLAGNDTLIGGLGKDTLTGGVGADVFKFNKISESSALAKQNDTITDFKHGQNDKIDLTQIDANALLVGKQAFSFIGNAAFSANATAQLRFDAKTSMLYASTNADSTAEFSILLSGVKSLVIEDFLL